MSISRMAALVVLLLFSASNAWADGAAVFQAQCSKCHGERGKSDTAISAMMKVPALAGDAKVAGMSDTEIAVVIKSNEKHPPTVKSLGDAEIAEAADFAKKLAAAK